LLSAGRWIANIIAGLFVPLLVTFVGAIHLLLMAGLSFGAAVFLLRFITHSYLPARSEKPQAPRAARPVKASTGFFKDRYVLLIFAYTVLWWVAFLFVENIYYNRAFAQYPDADQLTAFVGRLLSMIGIVALISSTVLSSRFIARFGLRAGLLAMPLAVTLTLGLLAVSGNLGAPLFFAFVLGAFAKLINVAFGFSLSLSANAIVYQSLPDPLRARVQATAEGIVQPMAVGFAGITLLALTAGLKFNYIGLAYVFVGLGIAWLIVIFLLSGNYVRALTRVITKRRLGDDASVLADPASIALLKERLHDGHAGIVIYALNKLEALDEQAIINELPN
jgi:ATP/ADP translocase